MVVPVLANGGGTKSSGFAAANQLRVRCTSACIWYGLECALATVSANSADLTGYACVAMNMGGKAHKWLNIGSGGTTTPDAASKKKSWDYGYVLLAS